jgi:hypothetical protein
VAAGARDDNAAISYFGLIARGIERPAKDGNDETKKGS